MLIQLAVFIRFELKRIESVHLADSDAEAGAEVFFHSVCSGFRQRHDYANDMLMAM